MWVEGLITIKERRPDVLLPVDGWEYNNATVHVFKEKYVISVFGFKFGSTTDLEIAQAIGKAISDAADDAFVDHEKLQNTFDNMHPDMVALCKVLRPIYNQYQKQGILA